MFLVLQNKKYSCLVLIITEYFILFFTLALWRDLTAKHSVSEGEPNAASNP